MYVVAALPGYYKSVCALRRIKEIALQSHTQPSCVSKH